ncbi:MULTISPECIES: sigma-70 family RNA polymerase sigma factor [Streptomyces]|uniref:Sigma-70 family RNA polymerase sigma factor n=1 Tax=Streptomyces ramulosus TaxID=47762 RepID=A0ABW1FQY6_9ACTN
MSQPQGGGDAFDLTPAEEAHARALFDEAFEKVVHTLMSRYRHLNFHESEDIAEVAFTNTLRHWRKIKPSSRASYFFKASDNLAISYFRKQQAERQAIHKAYEPECNAPPPDVEIERREKARAVRAAVASLPGNKAREVLTLQCNGLSDTEIAEQTGKSKDTVRSQRSKSFPQLREALSDYGKEGE